MKRILIAILVAASLTIGFGSQANAWDLAECQKVNFNHPDCAKFVQTSPAVFPTAKPQEKSDSTPTPTPTRTPVGKTLTPTKTAAPVKNLPATSTE